MQRYCDLSVLIIEQRVWKLKPFEH